MLLFAVMPSIFDVSSPTFVFTTEIVPAINPGPGSRKERELRLLMAIATTILMDPRTDRLISAAFVKWRTGRHIAIEKPEESSKYVIRGIGGRHLLQAEVGSRVPALYSVQRCRPLTRYLP